MTTREAFLIWKRLFLAGKPCDREFKVWRALRHADKQARSAA